MPDVTQSLRQAAPVAQRPLVAGYVSLNRPAPTSFTSSLFIVVPSYSTDYNFGPCKWGELHGTTLPVAGTKVVVAFDDQGVPVVVWWDGPAAFPPAAPLLITSGSIAASVAVPVDGQEVEYLADPANGVVWRFRYRAASTSAYKWEFVGGSPLLNAVASFPNLNQSAYYDWSGPAITAPLAGDYWIALGFRAYKVDAGKSTAYMSFQVGGTAASDGDAVIAAADQDTAPSVSRDLVKAAIPAASVLSSRFRNAAGVWSGANAWMRGTPIRVS